MAEPLRDPRTVTRLRLDQSAVNRLLTDRRGPVVLHQANLGRQIAGVARRIAPRGKGDGPHLAHNISSKLVPFSRGGWAVQIVAGVQHAIYVIKGTRPHSIGDSVLIEGGQWRYIGKSPSGKGKIHPGTKPNRFMQKAARQFGIRIRDTF